MLPRTCSAVTRHLLSCVTTAPTSLSKRSRSACVSMPTPPVSARFVYGVSREKLTTNWHVNACWIRWRMLRLRMALKAMMSDRPPMDTYTHVRITPIRVNAGTQSQDSVARVLTLQNQPPAGSTTITLSHDTGRKTPSHPPHTLPRPGACHTDCGGDRSVGLLSSRRSVMEDIQWVPSGIWTR